MTTTGWEERLAGLEAEPLDGDLTLIVARSFRERRRGLAKMAPLPPGYGLRILKCNSIHTIGMRFALDLVWLGRDGRVLRVDRGVRPVADEALRARALGGRDGSRAGATPSPLFSAGGRRLYWITLIDSFAIPPRPS